MINVMDADTPVWTPPPPSLPSPTSLGIELQRKQLNLSPSDSNWNKVALFDTVEEQTAKQLCERLNAMESIFVYRLKLLKTYEVREALI